MILRLLFILFWSLSLLSPAYTQTQTTTLDFDSIDGKNFDVSFAGSFGRGMIASIYLDKFGVAISDVTQGTAVVIVDTRKEYDGHAVKASSGLNALTQINSNDPISFTLNFPAAVQTVRFTRPRLLAGPTGITFPEWSAQALDERGRPLAEPVGEPRAGYYSDAPAQTFTLNGPGIRAVRFASNNLGSAFHAVVIDDLTLITSSP